MHITPSSSARFARIVGLATLTTWVVLSLWPQAPRVLALVGIPIFAVCIHRIWRWYDDTFCVQLIHHRRQRIESRLQIQPNYVHRLALRGICLDLITLSDNDTYKEVSVNGEVSVEVKSLGEGRDGHLFQLTIVERELVVDTGNSEPTYRYTSHSYIFCEYGVDIAYERFVEQRTDDAARGTGKALYRQTKCAAYLTDADYDVIWQAMHCTGALDRTKNT